MVDQRVAALRGPALRRTAFVVAAAGLLAVYLAWGRLGWGGPRMTAVGTGTVTLLANLAALVAGVRAARRPGTAGGAWRVAVAAFTATAAGQLLTIVLAGASGRPFAPVLAAPLFALGLGFALVAALRFPAPALRGSARLRVTLDGASLGGVCLLATWLYLVRANPRTAHPMPVSLHLVFLFAEVVVLTVLVAVAVRGRPRDTAGLWLLAAGVAAAAATTLGWSAVTLAHGVPAPGAPATLGWPLAALLVAAGALQRDPVLRAGADPAAPGLVLPYLPLLAAAAMLIGRPHPGGAAVGIAVGIGVLASARQVLAFTDTRAVATALFRSEGRFRALVAGAHDLTALIDADGVIGYISPSAGPLLGVIPGTLVGDHLGSLLQDDVERGRFAEALRACLAGEPVPALTLAAATASGQLWLELRLTDMRTVAHVGGVVVNARDVTAQRAAVSALAESEARHRRVVETAEEGIWVIDADGVTTLVNQRLAEILGDAADGLVGRPLADILEERQPGAGTRWRDNELTRRRQGETSRYELTLARADGSQLNLLVCASPLLDETGRFEGSLALVSDVTERHRLAEELTRLASTDELTGLANRRVFTEQVTAALAAQRRRTPRVAVLFLDLDGFKTVNDTLGHAAGDELLAEAAARLAACVRDGDVIARLGGDEFAVLLADVDGTPGAQRAADRMLVALASPLQVAGREVHVAGSVGVAVAEPGVTADELLRGADLAMYDAKRAGRGRASVYRPEMHAAALARAELENDLRVALTRGELEVHYQPIVRLGDAAPVSVEALVRWRHPTRGLLGPAAFLPVAEDAALIGEVGAVVLRAACRQVAEWRSSLGVPLQVSVNLAARQLLDRRVVADVVGALAGTGLPADALTLEITENALIDPAASSVVLDELRERGIRLALDDFGTGFSSLSHLRTLPAQVLKIDRSYVTGVGGDQQQTALTSAVVGLARMLGLHVVAEGVETVEQRAALEAMGCLYAQGFLFAEPMPAEQAGAWLALHAADDGAPAA